MKIKRKKRQYPKENLEKAFNYLKEKKCAVRAAARMFGIPAQTLRDRVIGLVDPSNDSCGPETLLSKEEELMLVEHVEVLAQLGYGYTNSSLKVLGGDLAFHLKRRNVQKPLSNNWLESFLRRWSDRLKSINPRSLESSWQKVQHQR